MYECNYCLKPVMMYGVESYYTIKFEHYENSSSLSIKEEYYHETCWKAMKRL